MAKLLKDPKILIIVVASLGYFVDIYDLILFNIVKKDSLMAIGIAESEIKNWEISLFSWQMAGMLVGGLLWGIWGDMRGRLKVLFGSILLYSLANIANAYVWDTTSYAIVRFVAGVGLAGELGAGITLVAETMKKEERGYGTMIIVTFGALGTVAAAFIASTYTWKTAYWVGGIMGLALLAMRVGTIESGMFKNIEHSGVSKGNFLMLFTQSKRFTKYMACILMGLPVWYIVGLVIALSESYFMPIFGIADKPKNSGIMAMMFCYIGLSFGDLVSGVLSQWWKSRLKVVMLYLVFTVVAVLLFFYTTPGKGIDYYYFMCFLVGTGTGYWALFVTVAAEQFGTNIRSTVTTTVPNFVRGGVIPITFGFKYLVENSGIGPVYGAFVVGAVCIGLALVSVLYLKETFGKDLNYIE